MKITKEQKEQMKKLSKEGKSQLAISRIMNIPQSTVNYWLNEESRFKKIEKQKQYYKGLSKEQKKQLNENQRKYRTDYYRNKYHSDPEYRKKRIELSKRYKVNHN